jgi:hypothetical protein
MALAMVTNPSDVASHLVRRPWSQYMVAMANDMWAEVEVQKGQLISVYRGRLDTKDVEAWQSGELRQSGRAIAIRDVFWSYDEGDGNEGWVVVGSTPGAYASGEGIAWVRGDLVLVVIPLRDGSEREAHRLRPRGGQADA